MNGCHVQGALPFFALCTKAEVFKLERKLATVNKTGVRWWTVFTQAPSK